MNTINFRITRVILIAFLSLLVGCEKKEKVSISENTSDNESSIVKEQNPSDLLSNGEWRDPLSNLIWMRCSLGQDWTGSECSGDAKKYSFDEAVLEAKKYNGWRIPEIDELRFIIIRDREGLNEPKDALFKPTKDDFGSYWSSTLVPNDPYYGVYFVSFMHYNIASYSPRNGPYYVRLVR